MPTLAEWQAHLYGSRRDLQLRAAKALLSREAEVQLADLLYIFDHFALDGLGASVERALLRRAGPELVAPMSARLASAERFRKEIACRVLGSCGDFAATPSLLAALRDPVMIVRKAAGNALASLKDPAALPALREAAKVALTDDRDVQAAIDYAIREGTKATPE